MKTLIIYPGSNTYTDALFYLIDPDNGEILDYHICSNAGFAKNDLYDYHGNLKETLKKEYNDTIEVKFIDETSYNINEIWEKYNQFKKEQKEKVKYLKHEKQ